MTAGLTSSSKPRDPHWRIQVCFPGILARSVSDRMNELKCSYSTYVVELVCNDLRKRRFHSTTQAIALEPGSLQRQIDLDIIRHCQLYGERTRESVREILHTAFEEARRNPRASFRNVKDCRWVSFTSGLREIIEIRWKELRYCGISEYVTSLLRYDLLRGGAHPYRHNEQAEAEVHRTLDEETVRLFHENAAATSEAVEAKADQAPSPLSAEESEAALLRISLRLRERTFTSSRVPLE